MSTSYKIKAGDTLESLSRKFYGVETETQLILEANPGLTEPLPVGITIVKPVLNTAVQNLPSQIAGELDEVAVIIDGRRFKFWSEVVITKSIDIISSIGLSALFEPDNAEFRNIFKPFSYKPIQITVGDTTLFTGTIIHVNPDVGSNAATVGVSGYARCGVLNDCTPPASMYPKLEFNKQSLQDIAKVLVKPFGVKAVFFEQAAALQTVSFTTVTGQTVTTTAVNTENESSIVFKRVECKTTTKVLDFLSELAKKRNRVISSNSDGDLTFKKPKTSGKSVAVLTEGEAPLISVTPNFEPQDYYSHITGISPDAVDADGSQYTVKNNQLNNLVRPLVFEPQDTEDSNLKIATEAKMGRMFGNMVSYSLELVGWRTPNGQLWSEDELITVTAPNAMIYNNYQFLIRDVEFRASENERSTLLTIVLPEAYSGKIPRALPWD